MRITFLVLAATTIGAAFIFGQNANEPKELGSLRESYQKARSVALAPIEKKYVDALTAMKERLTKAGNLEGALAVDAELKGILGAVSSSEKTTGESSDPGSSKAKLRALLPTLRIDGDGKWVYGNFPVAFTETEAILQPGSKLYEEKGAYEVIGPRKVRLTFPATAGKSKKTFEIEFTRDMAEFTSDRPDLKGKVTTVTPK